MNFFVKKIGIALVLFLLAIPGCLSSSGSATRLSSGEMDIERKARDCYEHGIAYMGKGHYLLARHQFAEAAAMAVTKNLHDDAMAGLSRVDKIIAERR